MFLNESIVFYCDQFIVQGLFKLLFTLQSILISENRRNHICRLTALLTTSRGILGVRVGVHRDKVGVIPLVNTTSRKGDEAGVAIYYDCDGVKTVAFWKLDNKICGDAFPRGVGRVERV